MAFKVEAAGVKLKETFKNENSIIHVFFHETQKEIFSRTFVLLFSIQPMSMVSKGCTKMTKTHHKSIIKLLRMTHVLYFKSPMTNRKLKSPPL